MLTNNTIKKIRSLSLKKNRKAEGLFVAEGEKIVNELIDSAFEIESIFATSEWKGSDAVIISEKELSRISFLKTPNKVLAVVRIPAESNTISGETIIALEGISDPGNLGTIIRLADWFGVEHILCSENSVDYLNPKVVQSSMGSISRVKVHYVNLDTDLNNYPDYKRYATVMDGDDYREIDFSSKRILIFGNESKGISESVLDSEVNKISIPKAQYSNAESLNIAVACGIFLSRL
ncbi:RNA methyltransferase [Flavobacteriales bacterium]|nr:RNA methyltransferase [Flavobacteriales bacterium]